MTDDSPSPIRELLEVPRQTRSKSVDHQIVPSSINNIQEKAKCAKCGHATVSNSNANKSKVFSQTTRK